MLVRMTVQIEEDLKNRSKTEAVERSTHDKTVFMQDIVSAALRYYFKALDNAEVTREKETLIIE